MIPHGLDFRHASAKPVRIDLDGLILDVPTDGHDHLYVTAFVAGEPLGSVVVASPIDPCPAKVLAEAMEPFALAMHDRRIRAGLERRPDRRLATVSVIVPTCDRPESLQPCLGALSRMAHTPLEVIVVDNGVRRDQTETIAGDLGAAYIVEPDRGAARARNRGLSVARGEVALFVDDDVEVDVDWSRRLAACFDDPLVMGVGGLILPGRLDKPAHWLSEVAASHGRGAQRRILDGALVAPTSASTIAVGASIGFRSSFLRSIGGFPEELGPGTAAKSGEETWAVYRLLSDGYRFVYEPAAISFHQHRDEITGLRNAIRGYGVGVGSSLLHALWGERDPSALIGFPHWLRYITRKMARSALRQPSAPPLRLPVTEALGMIRTPFAYASARWRAQRRERVVGRPLPVISAPWLEALDAPVPLDTAAELPGISVVIPTHGRRDRIIALLAALDDQDYPDERLEVVVSVDGDIDGTAQAIDAAQLRRTPKVVVDAQGGAGAARNRGATAASNELLVFFDDDILPTHSGVLLAHAQAHLQGRSPAVGPCLVDLRQTRDVLTQRLRSWWVDHVVRLLRAHALDFSDLSTGNFSIARQLFEDVGGFLEMQPREDWELGYRLIASGVPLSPATHATVMQEVEFDLSAVLENHRREGISDFEFARRHPAALDRLPLADWRQHGRNPAYALPILSRRRYEASIRRGRRVLRLLEAAGLRGRFGRRLAAMRQMSYWSGVAQAAGDAATWVEVVRRSERAAAGTVRIELGCDGWAPPPVDGPAVATVWDGGVVLGRVPFRVGGVPWDRSAFAAAAANRLARRTLGIDP